MKMEIVHLRCHARERPPFYKVETEMGAERSKIRNLVLAYPADSGWNGLSLVKPRSRSGDDLAGADCWGNGVRRTA